MDIETKIELISRPPTEEILTLEDLRQLLETNEHPGKLKDMVTSPGGTTITALHVLEKGKLRATLIKAVEAATLKSKSLK